MRDHFLYVVLRRKTLIRAELHEDSSLNRHNGSLSDEPCGTLPSAIRALPKSREVAVLHETSSEMVRVEMVKLRYCWPSSDALSYRRNHTAGPAPILIR